MEDKVRESNAWGADVHIQSIRMPAADREQRALFIPDIRIINTQKRFITPWQHTLREQTGASGNMMDYMRSMKLLRCAYTSKMNSMTIQRLRNGLLIIRKN